MSRVGREDVVAAYVEVLKGITGASYNLNIAGRVTRKFLSLSQLSDGDFPFVMVLDEPVLHSLNPDDHIYREDIRLWVYGVVRETSSDPWLTTAAPDAYRLKDDIVKITDANNRLGGLLPGVGTAQCVAWRSWTGLDPKFAACRVDVLIPWHFAPADLGPAD